MVRQILGYLGVSLHFRYISSTHEDRARLINHFRWSKLRRVEGRGLSRLGTDLWHNNFALMVVGGQLDFDMRVDLERFQILRA